MEEEIQSPGLRFSRNELVIDTVKSASTATERIRTITGSPCGILICKAGAIWSGCVFNNLGAMLHGFLYAKGKHCARQFLHGWRLKGRQRGKDACVKPLLPRLQDYVLLMWMEPSPV